MSATSVLLIAHCDTHRLAAHDHPGRSRTVARPYVPTITVQQTLGRTFAMSMFCA